MRRALAFVLATLILGLASQPITGQLREENNPALKALRMIDGQTGWATTLTGGRLLRSTDGGTNWSDVTPLNPSGQKVWVSATITAISSLVAWVIAAGSNTPTTTEIFRTVDGGLAWRSATIRAPDVISISFINSREGWLLAFLTAAAGSEAVEIYHSTDGGETWISVGPVSGLPFGGDKTAITFLNSTTGWITGATLQYDALYLYVTHDSGRTWRKQDLPIPSELTSHWRSLQQPPKPRFFTARNGILSTFYEIYAGPYDSLRPTGDTFIAIYATHDGGTTWTYSSVKRVNGFYLCSFADMNHGWLTNRSDLYATSDGGRRWTTIHPNHLPADVVQLDFISPAVGWARGQKSLHKTLDGGLTWAPLPYRILRQ